MTMLQHGMVGSSGSYQIANSLRFDGSNDYLSRTFGTPTDTKIFTLSFWCRRGKLGVSQYLLGRADGTGNVYFHSSDKLYWYTNNSGDAYQITTQLFRDPTAWLHIVIQYDTTQASDTNRSRIYVNGSEITAFDTDTKPGLNATTAGINAAADHRIGSYTAGSYLDGYLSDIYFIDGQALSPTSFGETNADGVWVPKAYSGSYGNNGFHLDFADGTSTTTLGYDAAGSNDWTLNGMTRAAGVNECWMTDTPTNNYATLNPLEVRGMVGGSVTFSNGNLMMSWATSAWRTVASNVVTAGKWYAEADVTQGGSATALIFGASTLSSLNNSSNLGDWSGSIGIGKGTAGAIFGVQGSYPSAPHTIGANDRNLVAVDCDNGKAWLGYYDASVPSTTWYSSTGAATGNPDTGANPTMTFTAGTEMVFAHGIYATSTAYAAYFGANGFAATKPTTFKALCTANLPAVAIPNPKIHHNVYTVTKSGNTNFTLDWDASVYDTLFEIKQRNGTGDWYQVDGLRGYDKILKSNSTAAETTDANVIGVSGTTITLKSTLADGTYVIRAFKAGLTASRQTNTDGSITSTVSRNVTSGFAIVSATGNGTTGTIGHGLGKALKFINAKDRDTAIRWTVMPGTAAQYGYYNETFDFLQANQSLRWGNNTVTVEPTSTVFTVGNSTDVNGSGKRFVFYCHAEIPGYSKFGFVTCNASTDNAFIYTGLSGGSFVEKCSSGTGNWVLIDSVRQNYNVQGPVVLLNSNAIESAQTYLDMVASGEKIRSSGGDVGAAHTYFYSHIGGIPFGGSNVSPAPAR